jgi:hypothetical protein
MRPTRWMTHVLVIAGGTGLLALGGCNDGTAPSGGSGLTATEASDIGAADADEIDQSMTALLTPTAAAVSSPTAPGCATVDNATDTDGDLVPDQATYTFALPACHFTGFRGGSLDVTGTIVLSDPTPDAADFVAAATLTDFTFAYTSPNATWSYSAVRNGTRALSGNASGASLSNQVTVVRTYPNRPDGTVVHNLLLSFTPDAGQQLAYGEPLPSGTFTRSGTFTWSRGSVSRTFTVTTVVPLVWDASCATDRKIASGETHAALADGSYIRTVWNGCGVDPTRTFVPAS